MRVHLDTIKSNFIYKVVYWLTYTNRRKTHLGVHVIGIHVTHSTIVQFSDLLGNELKLLLI